MKTSLWILQAEKSIKCINNDNESLQMNQSNLLYTHLLARTRDNLTDGVLIMMEFHRKNISQGESFRVHIKLLTSLRH